MLPQPWARLDRKSRFGNWLGHSDQEFKALAAEGVI
jgi:hypothetical protein